MWTWMSSLVKALWLAPYFLPWRPTIPLHARRRRSRCSQAKERSHMSLILGTRVLGVRCSVGPSFKVKSDRSFKSKHSQNRIWPVYLGKTLEMLIVWGLLLGGWSGWNIQLGFGGTWPASEREYLMLSDKVMEWKELFLAISDSVNGSYNNHIVESHESFEVNRMWSRLFTRIAERKGSCLYLIVVMLNSSRKRCLFGTVG